MTQESFGTRLTNIEKSIIEWLTKVGAEVDDEVDLEDDEFLDTEILGLRVGDVEIFIGEATCYGSDFVEIKADANFDLSRIQRRGHHHLEVAALAVQGSPFDVSTLDAMVDDLRPDLVEEFVIENDTFTDGTMKPSFCAPFLIEVSTEGPDNNVWVVRRFRVEDAETSNFNEMMAEFWDLIASVRERVLA